jgi:Mn2+/Fe2+ NRAMP family transporter
MLSAAGSGELLFTPRVGALYGYTLLWAMLGAVAFKWIINREIGRFTVCSGTVLLEGFRQVPGPRHWALWAILVPQLVVAVATIAGLAGSAATALALVLPGPLWLWALGGILASTAVVLWGKYQAVERIAIAIAIALTGSAVIAAASVSPDLGALARGLVPQAAPGMRLADVLPWLGFLLSGAAGMIWYSYWLHAKGYALTGRVDGRPADFERLSDTDTQRLKGWLRQMTLDNTMAVAGTLVVTIAFLILGAELLRPLGIVSD